MGSSPVQSRNPYLAKMTEYRVDATERLQEEHRVWKISHPLDFKAEPSKTENGGINWLEWNCAIPGKLKTAWEGGMYNLKLLFPKDYPYRPPRCVFDPVIIHPNVFPSGAVSLSLLEEDWKPQTTVYQILLGVQLLLDDPNFHEPAQVEAYVLYNRSRLAYEEKIREQAKLAQVS